MPRDGVEDAQRHAVDATHPVGGGAVLRPRASQVGDEPGSVARDERLRPATVGDMRGRACYTRGARRGLQPGRRVQQGGGTMADDAATAMVPRARRVALLANLLPFAVLPAE